MRDWLWDNWFNLISAIGITASLLFTAVSLRSETKNRRIASLLSLTENHRDLWSKIFDHPELGRIRDSAADLSKQPVTLEESIYVGLAIQHLGSAYQAMKAGIVIRQDGLCDDIKAFLSLPIPKHVWDETKRLQNADFVEYVERCRNAVASNCSNRGETRDPTV